MHRGLVLLLVYLLPLPAAAEEDPRAADHEQLRGLLQEAKRAVNAFDLDALAALLAPDFVLTLADQRVITDREGLDAYFHGMFRAEDAPLQGITIEPEALTRSQFIADEVAVAYGVSTDSYQLPADQSLSMESRWTATLVKDQESWRIRSLHIGVDILDNPILTAARQGSYVWALGGLVIGAIVGWMGGRGQRRRSG